MAVIEHMKSHHSKIRINLGHAMNMSLTLLKTKNRNLKMNGTFSEVIILKLISIKMNPEGALKPSKFICNCCGKVVFETNFTGNGSPTAKRWFKILYSDLITHFIGSEEGEDVCLKVSSVQLELLLESMMNDLNWWNSTDNPSNNHIHQFFWSWAGSMKRLSHFYYESQSEWIKLALEKWDSVKCPIPKMRRKTVDNMAETLKVITAGDEKHWNKIQNNSVNLKKERWPLDAEEQRMLLMTMNQI